MKKELIKTEDGSHSIYLPEMDENYHSTHGAWTESMHIFIKHGLKFIHKPSCSILEVGFGTGLNALLTAQVANEFGKDISYHTLEAYPVPMDIIEALNFDEMFQENNPGDKSYFKEIHAVSWNTPLKIHSNFTLHKQEVKLQNCQFSSKYDLIYFDAFAPEKQADMWTEEIFIQLYDVLNPLGVLTTYCAKGVVKRMLKSAGFTVKNFPGPPGKREITVAFKNL